MHRISFGDWPKGGAGALQQALSDGRCAITLDDGEDIFAKLQHVLSVEFGHDAPAELVYTDEDSDDIVVSTPSGLLAAIAAVVDASAGDTATLRLRARASETSVLVPVPSTADMDTTARAGVDHQQVSVAQLARAPRDSERTESNTMWYVGVSAAAAAFVGAAVLMRTRR